MGLGFFRKAMAMVLKYRPPNMIIQNTIQTNGTLIDDEWCRFFEENNFLVGLSLDGPREIHDTYRVWTYYTSFCTFQVSPLFIF
jgi:uncharacterized protein